MEIDMSLNKGANRGKSGGTGELPVMTTLSNNTNSTYKETKSNKQPTKAGVYNLLPNSMNSNPTHRMPKGATNFSMAQRS